MRNFLSTDTCILCEQTEGLAVGVKSKQVLHVFENVVEMAILGSSGEENTSIAPFNCVFFAGSLIVRCRFNHLNITHSERLEKITCQIKLLRGSSNWLRYWLWNWFWLWDWL